MAYNKYAFILTIFVNAVESRRCDYVADGFVKIFFCNAYEYCCGNACCRPAALTFYQLWYFWLSIILILLLCSGGSWWYRFKYRGHVLSQPHTSFTSTTTTFGQGPSEGSRPPNATGVFYYPGGDRVYFHAVHKDNLAYRFMMNESNPAPYGSTATQFTHLPAPAPMPGMGMGVAPPPYAGPPPSYDSVVQGNPPAQQVSQTPLRPPAPHVYPPDHTSVTATTTSATEENTVKNLS